MHIELVVETMYLSRDHLWWHAWDSYLGLGNLRNCGCCSIWPGDKHSSFPVGDWPCLERNSFWWFQEPFAGASACRKVHEKGSSILWCIFLSAFKTWAKQEAELFFPLYLSYRKLRSMSTSPINWLLGRWMRHLICCTKAAASGACLICNSKAKSPARLPYFIGNTMFCNFLSSFRLEYMEKKKKNTLIRCKDDFI